jgi:hypothetical protein
VESAELAQNTAMIMKILKQKDSLGGFGREEGFDP